MRHQLSLLLISLIALFLFFAVTDVVGFQTLPLPASRVSLSSSRRHDVVMRTGDHTSTNNHKKDGRGFGIGVKQTRKMSNGGGDGRMSSLRPRAPNSFSSIGKAVRLRGKFGGGPMGMGLLDGYSKMMEQAEMIKERYSGRRPVQEGGGRQRGAKKAATFHALSSYSLHFLRLLEEELVYEEAEVVQRLRYWPRGRLMEEGLAVFGVVARPRGKLFKEYILRFTLPARKGSASSGSSAGGGAGSGSAIERDNGGRKKDPTSPSWEGSRGSGRTPPSSKKGGRGPASVYPRAPPLHYHRLGPGDIISITPDKQNPLGSEQVVEGLVLERGAFYVDVVVKEIPPGVVWRRGDPTGGERFRLDLYLNRISFQRMVAAVHQVTGLETGYTVSPEIRDILVKSFAERFDVVSPTQTGSGGGGGDGGGVGGGYGSHSHHSLLAMSPYAAAAAANKKAARQQQTLAKRMREDEDTGHGGRCGKRKGISSSSGGGGSATDTTTITIPRKRKDGSSPLRKSSWEALAGAVPKTSFARKDAEQMVSQEVTRFKLNESQEKALRMALSRKLSLIQGPPGTGKTRTACHLVNIAVKLGQRRDSGKVLAVAFSNVAADNLLEGCLRLGLKAVRVGRAATVRPELRNHTLDALLMQHESVNTFKKMLEASRGSTSREVQAAKRDLEDAELMAAVSILGNADVVVSTCVGAANEVIINAASVTGRIGGGGTGSGSNKGDWDDFSSPFSMSSSSFSSPLRAIKFPTVIIDEASQATEPATLIPLTQGCEQLVLVGDHYQLPPTIKSMRAAQQGLGVSLFTRLAMAGIQPSLLTLQYRMHPFIAQFPSQRFYGGLLQSHPANIYKRPRPEGFPWPHPSLPVAFVAVGGDEDDTPSAPFYEQRTNGNQTSYLNRKEADVLMEVLGGVLRGGQVQSTDVGIVTPYSAQVKHVTELAQHRLRNFKPTELEIQSVDAYQGREKELILMSAVRSNGKGKVGFLGDWRRLNVAITRAKRGLIVLGDPRTLRHDPHWGAYLKWAQKHGCVMTLGELRKRFE
ncbi:hypothetical protein VYU27_001350 [Nannochloropsis oceanica]